LFSVSIIASEISVFESVNSTSILSLIINFVLIGIGQAALIELNSLRITVPGFTTATQ
jgi:hypothetical protein